MLTVAIFSGAAPARDPLFSMHNRTTFPAPASIPAAPSSRALAVQMMDSVDEMYQAYEALEARLAAVTAERDALAEQVARFEASK